MGQCGSKSAATRAAPIDGGEDRLSALPDDLIRHIVVRLDTTAEAARTSVLARRWRDLWRDLPEVRFHFAPDDGHRIRDLLDAPNDAPELRCISVAIATNDDAPDSVAAWLPAAARRLGGALDYYVQVQGDDDGEEDEATQGRCHVQLPCFEKATKINLDLGYLGLAFPPHGNFGRLTDLYLSHVRFNNPCNLGNAISSPRCPCLQTVVVVRSEGLHNLTIHSQSLLRVKFWRLLSLQQLTIVSPTLQELVVKHSFLIDDESEPSATISAPLLVSLEWEDVYDPQLIDLGNLEQLERLRTYPIFVYGTQNHREKNQSCQRLLQRFKTLHTLNLSFSNLPVTDDYQYLLGDITVLPQVMILDLDLHNGGHAFGANLCHLLRMCSGLRGLFLAFCTSLNFVFEDEFACRSGCICDLSTGWKTDELVLNHLEVVHIMRPQGSEHEVDFVKRLLICATVLKIMRITFDNQISEAKIKMFHDALAGLSGPETCVQFEMSDNV